MNRYKYLALFIVVLIAFSGCAGNSDHGPKTGAHVSGIDVDAAEPAIAADQNGNIYVTYVQQRSGNAADLVLAKFDSGFDRISDNVRVDPESAQVKSWYGDPPTIAVAGDTVYVGWTASVEGGSELLLSVSHDGGKSFEAPVRVNDDKRPAAHGMHSLAVDRAGRIYIAWLDERHVSHRPTIARADTVQRSHSENASYVVHIHHNDAEHQHSVHESPEAGTEPNSEVYFAVSTDGGKTFSANKKLAGEVCPCCKTAIAIGPDGKLFVSWRQVLADSCRHIAVASSSDGGELFSHPVIVSDDKWKINACPVSGAALAVDASSALNVAWYTAGDAGQPGLYTAVSLDGAKSFGLRTLESADAISGTPTLLETGQGPVSVFAAGRTVRIRAGSSGVTHIIDNAQFPAASYADGKVYVAFVRDEGGTRQVELTGF